ncbi:PD40 domain-containing protein, partial [candidate division WOR-3 bacterium]|nr:PD40 domain-containing protein [candidate division WOR-3 bacterium]
MNTEKRIMTTIIASVLIAAFLMSPVSATHLTEPNDPDYPKQWGLNNFGINPGVPLGIIDADIDAPQAWEHCTDCRKKGTEDLIIAILDTGLDLNHEDLKDNIWKNPKEQPGDANGDGFPGIAGVDDDGDGLIDEDSNGNQPWDIFEILGNDIRPSWSPDGALIAFSSDRTGNFDIYTFPGSGGMISEITRITTDPATDSDPSWSPDGTKIAFSSDRSGNFDIWVINATGGTATQITTNVSDDHNPYWSPDGTKIVFESDRSGNFDIWIINATGGTATQVTTDVATDISPAWSHDGTNITFSSDRSGNFDIWVINATGGTATQITTNVSTDDLPTWSPDGAQIFFDSDRSGNIDIWVINATGGTATQITTNPATDSGPTMFEITDSIEDTTLSPPIIIAFSSNRAGNFNIWTILFPDGEPATRITFTGTGSAYINDLKDDDDENGYADDIYGWNFVKNNNNVLDDHGHGTHVAGIIAANGNNGKGVTGVCWKGNVMILKILDKNGYGAGPNAYVKATDYATKNGAKILSNSWGGRKKYPELEEAIKRSNKADVIYVAAAGNRRPTDTELDNDKKAHYPSGYDVPNVVAVAASDNRDNLANFSHYGKKSVDLAAPGKNIYSTLPGNKYGYMSGTSMATPFVSGSVAHFWSLFPGLNNAQVKYWILKKTDPRPNLAGRVVSGEKHNGRFQDGRLRMISGFDFGDAPDPFPFRKPIPQKNFYPTKQDDSDGIGAAHEDIGEEWLGYDVSPEFDADVEFPYDADPDQRPNIHPDRKPNDPEPPYRPGEIPDLEMYDDGVFLFPPYIPGQPGRIDFVVTTENPFVKDSDRGRYDEFNATKDPRKKIYVNVYFDWNKDGDWDDLHEHIVPYPNCSPATWWGGPNMTDCLGNNWTAGNSKRIRIDFTVPVMEKPGDVWVRVRLDYGENVGQKPYPIYESISPQFLPGAPIPLWQTRRLAQFGEVEDHDLSGWRAKWPTVLLYVQKGTKYSIEIFLNKTGYVTRVDF